MLASQLTLSSALRVDNDVCLALVGAGGKTTAMSQLARQFPNGVILACSTHLGAWQTGLADRHFIIEQGAKVSDIGARLPGVSLFTGPLVGEQRLAGLDEGSLRALRDLAKKQGIPMLIEADGSRQRPLKAPAGHEPVIPSWVKQVVVAVGLSGLGQPVATAVFRPELYAQLAGVEHDALVTPQMMTRVLCHPQGGLKGIPAGARRVALLNQADNEAERQAAYSMTAGLLSVYDQVLVTSLKQETVYAARQPVAGVILAAGGSSRLGRPKTLLEWQGKLLVRIAAESALEGGLSPVIVVLGAVDEPVRSALDGLAVAFIHNLDWQAGQSTSLRAGLQEAQRLCLPRELGAAVFLLADQPFVRAALVLALREQHSRSLAPVVAPYIGDRRSNPVLFDQVTFSALAGLQGDSGGRTIFSRYPPSAVPWDDERLLIDIDTPDDVQRLQDLEADRD